MIGRLRRLAPAAVPALLLVLASVPATRWILARQAAPGNDLPPLTRSANLGPEQVNERRALVMQADREYRAAAAASPSDYRIQLGVAIATWQPSIALPRLRRLEARFPQEASAAALALRFAAADDIVVSRLEEGILSPTGMVYRVGAATALPDAARLGAFERDAAIGRRLQNDNAWFPLMAAVGWCADHQDSRALAALADAALCTRFSAGTGMAIRSVWAVQTAAYGGLTGADRLAAVKELRTWQYVRIRDMARWAAARAVELEQNGDLAGGLRIREYLAACASLLVGGARTVVGRLVGSSLFVLAIARPGGARAPGAGSSDASPAARLATFKAYLVQHGWAAQAGRWKAGMAAALRVRQIAAFADGRTGPANRLANLNAWIGVTWLAGRIVLFDWLWLFAVGCAALLAARARHEAVRGVVLVAALAALATFCGWVATAASSAPVALLLVAAQGLVPVVCLVLALATTARSNQPPAQRLGGAALAASAAAGMLYLMLLGLLLPLNSRARKMAVEIALHGPAVAARSGGLAPPEVADWLPLLSTSSGHPGIG